MSVLVRKKTVKENIPASHTDMYVAQFQESRELGESLTHHVETDPDTHHVETDQDGGRVSWLSDSYHDTGK